MTDDKRLTGAELLCVRERMGLSQRQLAKILRVSQAALAHWEKEVDPIPDWAVDHFIVICEEWEGRVTAWTRTSDDTITIPRDSHPDDDRPATWYRSIAVEAAERIGKKIAYEK